MTYTSIDPSGNTETKTFIVTVKGTILFLHVDNILTFMDQWGTVAHWLKNWTHDHKVVVLAPTGAHCVESLTKTLNPHDPHSSSPLM